MAQHRSAFDPTKNRLGEPFGDQPRELRGIMMSDQIDAMTKHIERLEFALRVPDVWSEFERDGLARAYGEASKKHGHYESLFAAAAWLLRHRASQVS